MVALGVCTVICIIERKPGVLGAGKCELGKYIASFCKQRNWCFSIPRLDPQFGSYLAGKPLGMRAAGIHWPTPAILASFPRRIEAQMLYYQQIT